MIFRMRMFLHVEFEIDRGTVRETGVVEVDHKV